MSVAVPPTLPANQKEHYASGPTTMQVLLKGWVADTVAVRLLQHKRTSIHLE